MKKLISIVFVTLFLSASSIFAQWVPFNGATKAEKPNITVLSSDDSSILIDVSIPGMETAKRTEEGNIYDVLRFPGYFTTLEIGKPQLPVIRELLAVPVFTRYKFSIVDSAVITLTNYNVFPFLTPVAEGKKEKFTIDETFYQQDSFFPNKVVELDKPGVWRDIRVSTLSILPVQFNPKTETLKIYQKVVIKIDFEQITGNAFVREKSISTEWEKLYKNSIINYDFLPQKLNKINSIMTIGDYDYLIITDDDYSEIMEPFAQWKTRKGLLTKIVTISSIGNNQTNIKNYITNEFNDHNIQYVLLVGDISEIAQSCDPQYQLWGDYWYSLLIGSDYIADISIGRISATTQAEVNHILQKGINYETSPPNDTWVKNVLLVSHLEDAPDTYSYQWDSENIRTASYYDNPSFTTAYGSSYANGGDQATNSMVINYINAGFGVVNYRGHGGSQYWWAWNIYNENFSNSEVANLNNNKLPIVFSIACNTSHLWSANDCLGEAFTKSNYGATAFLGATGETYPLPNGVLDTSLFKASFDYNIYSIGMMFTYAVAKMLIRFPVGNAAKWTALKYLWLGDPAIELWTNTLSTFNNPSVTDNGNSVVVNTGVGDCNIIACSIDNGETYFSNVTSASSATFSTAVRPLYITITKHNYLPYTAITGGNLTSNITLSNDLIVVGDLTVNSGVTLTVNLGAELKFSNGVSLIINGTLNINGTSNNNVVFDFGSPNSDTQNGIILNPGSTATIDYAEIENAWNGIFINQNDALIRYCTIHDCRYGIYLYDTDTYSQHPYSDDTQLQNNLIYDTWIGIVMYGSSPFITGNECYNNYTGVGCADYSSPYLGHADSDGDNYLHDNDYGLFCYNYSDAYLGRNSCTTPGGDNRVHDNNYYDVNSYGNCFILAENNWWGTSPPSQNQFNMFSGSSIDYDPWLTSPPLAKTSAIAASSPEEELYDQEIGSPGTEGKVYNYDEKWPILWKLHYARNLILVEDYEFAYEITKKAIEDYPDSLLSSYAMTLMTRAGRKHDMKKFVNDLRKLSETSNKKKIHTSAGIHLIKFLGDERLQKIEEILSNNEDKEVIIATLFQKFLYTYHNLNDMEAARIISNQLDLYDPESGAAVAAHHHLGDNVFIYPGKAGKKNNVAGVLPDDFKLIGNYPNPFNPSTTIKYALPNTADVKINIYGMTGSKIYSVVRTAQPGGYYQIQWNGSNNSGQQVSSGIYICRFEAASREDDFRTFISSLKLMLIK